MLSPSSILKSLMHFLRNAEFALQCDRFSFWQNVIIIITVHFYFRNIFQGTMKLSDTKSTESTQFYIISTSIKCLSWRGWNNVAL